MILSSVKLSEAKRSEMCGIGFVCGISQTFRSGFASRFNFGLCLGFGIGFSFGLRFGLCLGFGIGFSRSSGLALLSASA